MVNYDISPYYRLNKRSGDKYILTNYLINKVCRIKKKHYNIIEYIEQSKKAFKLDDLINLFEAQDIQFLVDMDILINQEKKWLIFQANTLEIEISTVCNWKCRYCPMHYTERAPFFMDENLFINILDKGVEYRHIKYITLHGYNEPTLDKRIANFIRQVIKKGFILRLYTNGSNMTSEIWSCLLEYKNMVELYFNFPSLDKQHFYEITASQSYEKSFQAIQFALEKGFCTTILSQRLLEESKYDEKKFKEIFPTARILIQRASDRSGVLTNEFCDHFYTDKKILNGCLITTKSIFVSAYGDVYLCCNDFYKQHILGSLKTQSILEVFQSMEAITLRKKIWGGRRAEKDFICRRCKYIM